MEQCYVQFSVVRVQCFITLFLVQLTSLFLLMFRFIFRNTFRVASGSESFYQSVSVQEWELVLSELVLVLVEVVGICLV